MKQLTVALFLIVLFSCGKEKSIKLPEIEKSKTTDIKNVSSTYFFYNKTKPDSLELDQKNLIKSTNWLINVDKRLTLKQAIPSIIKLQNKKLNAKMTKNEKTRNYYTCNHTSIKNSGFIDFTDIIYKTYKNNDEEILPVSNSFPIYVIIKSLNEILINNEFIDERIEINKFNSELKKVISKINLDNPDHGGDFISISLSFNRNLSFQDYISIKSKLINFKMENVVIRNNEYIF